MRNHPGGILPKHLLECLIHHVVLPPKLPGREEDFVEVINDSLCQRIENASVKLRDSLGEAYYNEGEDMRLLLRSCRVLNWGGNCVSRLSLKNFAISPIEAR